MDIKSVNIWQSYKQERDCLVHFLRLLFVCWPGAQCVQHDHAHANNCAKYSSILNKLIVFTCRLSNKPFFIWLLTTRSHLKYVDRRPCNLSLMVWFADINVSQDSVATYAGGGWIFNIDLTTNLPKHFPIKTFFNRSRFDRIMVTSLWPHLLAHPVWQSFCSHVMPSHQTRDSSSIGDATA